MHSTALPRFQRPAFFICQWVAAAGLLLSQQSEAHPLLAEPINHPYVFTFDQFHLKVDGDESLTRGGLLLMAETNCAACHAAPDGWKDTLVPRPGPNLQAVGSRLDADTLWLMVRSPQHRKKGTLMPGMFSGAEGDAEKVEALTQYLITLKQDCKPMPQGNPENGKKLYHTVGCVACHEPASDYRPPTAPVEGDIDRPGNGSNPIALADAYDIQALGRFLLNPHETRPAGRMPAMHLTEQEAADLAAYLHIGRTAEKAAERAALKIAPQSAETGRALFVEQRCSVCHTADRPMDKRLAKPLLELKVDSAASCVAEKTAAGTPRFDFNELQRHSIALALKHVQTTTPAIQAVQQRIDWQMLRLNCYACHDRDGIGGPEDARAQYFMAADSGAESLGELGKFPPTLDKVGWKLTGAWMHRVLHGEGGSVRPYLAVRMPNFGEANTTQLPDQFMAADKPENPPAIDTSGLAKHHRYEFGRKLMGITGLGCVTCHGLKDRKSLGVPVINLTHTVERLNPTYFKALLLNPAQTQPGTLMPPMFMNRKKADQEIEQIWTYLKEVDQQPLPEGLLKTDDYELKPEKAGKPIVFRTFMEGVGTHAICVGFPQGIHAAFDAERLRWALAWRGRFVDAFGTWQDRAMPPAKPMGEAVQKFERSVPLAQLKVATEPWPTTTAAEQGYEFKGYRLDEQGVPTFLYRVKGIEVEDKVSPANDGKGLVRTLRLAGNLSGWFFHGLSDRASPVPAAPVLTESIRW